ncbi:MAG: hypothetical protein ACP5FK_08915 [bacterium]
MLRTIIILFAVVAVNLSGNDLIQENYRLILFKDLVFDLDKLDFVDSAAITEFNVVWDVSIEPVKWDKPELSHQGQSIQIWENREVLGDEMDALMGILTIEDVESGEVIVVSKLVLRDRQNQDTVWVYNPNPPLCFGKYIKAVFPIGGNNIYIAIFDLISTGAGLVCLDVRSGEEIWRGDVEQLMVPHSIYLNEVFIKVVDGKVILAGDESAGYYLQIFDAESGERLYSKINWLW